MPDGGQQLVEFLSPFWHHQKEQGPGRMDWVKRRVKGQGQKFWVVRSWARMWVRCFLVN